MSVLISNNPIPTVSAPSSTAQPAVDHTLNRAISAAVGKLNDAGYPGEGREVTFSIDQATKRPVIKVIETSTKEVITQWPPEYLLEMAAENTNDR